MFPSHCQLTYQEIFKAIQVLGEVTANHYGDPGYDQLAIVLTKFSWTFRNEAQENLKVTKIMEFFSESLFRDLLHLSDNFKHLKTRLPHLHSAVLVQTVTQRCRGTLKLIIRLIWIVRLSFWKCR